MARLRPLSGREVRRILALYGFGETRKKARSHSHSAGARHEKEQKHPMRKHTPFACDTSCIITATPRRVLMGLAHSAGQKTIILPRVFMETSKGTAKIERHLTKRELKEKHPDEEDRIEEFCNRAATAAVEWWHDECSRNDSPILVLDEHFSMKREYDLEFAKLPEEAFEEGMDQDREILAQAIVHEIQIVTINNFNSIDVEMLERRSNRGLSRCPRVLTIRETLEDVANILDVDPGDHILTVIARMTVSEKRRKISEDMQSMNTMIDNLSKFEKNRKIPMGRTVSHLARETLEKLQAEERKELLDTAWHERPTEVRQVESRRIARLRQGRER